MKCVVVRVYDTQVLHSLLSAHPKSVASPTQSIITVNKMIPLNDPTVHIFNPMNSSSWNMYRYLEVYILEVGGCSCRKRYPNSNPERCSLYLT